MAEHRVPKGNIIYIIPTDELFIKYKNNEAFIDEYGRLMNRKPHRVLKELKHYVADSEVQESYASPIKDLAVSVFQVILHHAPYLLKPVQIGLHFLLPDRFSPDPPNPRILIDL